MILAGDVGGTKTDLALFERGKLSVPAVARSQPSQSFQGLDRMVAGFLGGAGVGPADIEAACFGVAGPVVGGRVEATNLPWVVSGEALARSIGVEPLRVRLLNDLEATGHGISLLPPDRMVTLNEGIEDLEANGALIAAGTGLGEAVLIREQSGRLRPEPSEGAHCDFAPRDDEEVALLRYLWRNHDHVSYERLVSGPGLVNIYRFLRERGGFGPEPRWLGEQLEAGDEAASVAAAAEEHHEPACERALELFVSLYGAEAGNLALKVMALGGVYIGGGIAPKLRDRLASGPFVEAFVNKGRFRPLLERVPIRLILDPRTALLGAARLGAEAAAA